MLIKEIIKEVKVQSSWISNLTYNRSGKIITWRLNNGKVYIIPDISRRMFDRWKAAGSKGQFFHSNIKKKYTVQRLA